MKILFAVLIGATSFNAFGQGSPKTKEQSKVVGLISALPEVIISNKYSLKNYKLPLVIDVDSYPTKDRNYYSVSVYFDRRDIEKLSNLYHFEVDAKTNAIRVWDIPSDKVMSLKVWRKQQHKH